MKTIIVTDQDNVSPFEFTIIIRRYYNVYFHVICADVVYPPRKSHSYLLIFPPVKDFLDVHSLERPSQMYTILKFPEILTISPHFDNTFVHISRHLRVFAS